MCSIPTSIIGHIFWSFYLDRIFVTHTLQHKLPFLVIVFNGKNRGFSKITSRHVNNCLWYKPVVHFRRQWNMQGIKFAKDGKWLLKLVLNEIIPGSKEVKYLYHHLQQSSCLSILWLSRQIPLLQALVMRKTQKFHQKMLLHWKGLEDQA